MGWRSGYPRLGHGGYGLDALQHGGSLPLSLIYMLVSYGVVAGCGVELLYGVPITV
ncbi:MAG: hypothetical protein QW756_06750 [Nitrososphaerota archaeon]